jgi:hypothetical protein
LHAVEPRPTSIYVPDPHVPTVPVTTKKPNENKYNHTANALAFLPLAAQRPTPTRRKLWMDGPFLMKLAANLGES